MALIVTPPVEWKVLVVVESKRRIVWRSLCDQISDFSRVWVDGGMKAVVNSKYPVTAIVFALGGLGIGIKALAVSFSALLMKMGSEVYCALYSPQEVMEIRPER